MTKTQKTVAIYARVSTDKQAVDMQLAELQDYPKKREWGFIRNILTRAIVAVIPKGQHSAK
ncbi:MAG: recombinase family protein [Desulfobacteraceae bacterium]|nr:recombinase family protein [Desulfobacteraceae bacterium]